MTELSVHVNQNGMVSSKLIAEKFGKRHDNVLRDYKALRKSLPLDFSALNFEEQHIPTLNRNKTELSEVLMSRNGFSLLAMGFTGQSALKWKCLFLEAFVQMEETIKSEIPSLKAKIATLEQEKLSLSATKKPHGNKGLVPAIQMIDTLFGTEPVMRRVHKDDPRVSEISKLEGKARHMMGVSCGMQTEAIKILDKVSGMRRK